MNAISTGALSLIGDLHSNFIYRLRLIAPTHTDHRQSLPAQKREAIFDVLVKVLGSTAVHVLGFL